MRVAVFATCLVDGAYPEAGKSTVSLLRRLGFEVGFPSGQTCCGQMHVNSGYQRQALPLIRNHIAAFAGYDAVVAPSGSCVASVRHQHPEVARRLGDERLAGAAAELAGRTYELSQFLTEVAGVTDVGAYYPHRVTYHPSCHGLRLLRSGDSALRLLREVRGIDLAELPDATTCCGFGGVFSLKNPDLSVAMLADKMRDLLTTRAEVCTATDVSCLMHIGGGLSRLSAGMRTAHLAEILAAAEPASPASAASPASGADTARADS